MDEIIVNNLPENTSPTAADKLMLIRNADGTLTLVSAGDLSEVGGGGLTPAIKSALLQLAEKVAYVDANGQDYYDDLYDALYAVTAISVSPSSVGLQTIGGTQQLTATTTPSGATVSWASSNTAVATVDANGLVTSVGYGSATITATAGQLSATCAVVVAQATVTSIDAVYTQSGTVYDTDSLDSLKDDLVVTAHWSNGTTSTVASADYTLSGTLSVGTSTVSVSYSGKTATFVVNVTAAPTLSSIAAVFTQGQTVVYDTDSLDSLKSMLVVTATYSDSSTQTVPSTDYTLSGTLTAGTSTITVSYGGETATFDVTVTHFSAPVTVYFEDLTWENTVMKKDGTTATLTRGHHLTVPYYEGMEIHTIQNAAWIANYPPFILYSNSQYTVPDYETISASRYKVTLSNLPSDVVIYVNWYGTSASVTTPPHDDCYYTYTP